MVKKYDALIRELLEHYFKLAISILVPIHSKNDKQNLRFIRKTLFETAVIQKNK